MTEIQELGLDELDDKAAIVLRDGDELYSFIGDYGPADEEFRRLAQGTLFWFGDDEILVNGDFNGHAVFNRLKEDDALGMITWKRLVEECEPVCSGWIEMPE